MGMQAQAKPVCIASWILRNAVTQSIDDATGEKRCEESVDTNADTTALILAEIIVWVVKIEGRAEIDGLPQPQVETGKGDELVVVDATCTLRDPIDFPDPGQGTKGS